MAGTFCAQCIIVTEQRLLLRFELVKIGTPEQAFNEAAPPWPSALLQFPLPQVERQRARSVIGECIDGRERRFRGAMAPHCHRLARPGSGASLMRAGQQRQHLLVLRNRLLNGDNARHGRVKLRSRARPVQCNCGYLGELGCEAKRSESAQLPRHPPAIAHVAQRDRDQTPAAQLRMHLPGERVISVVVAWRRGGIGQWGALAAATMTAGFVRLGVQDRLRGRGKIVECLLACHQRLRKHLVEIGQVEGDVFDRLVVRAGDDNAAVEQLWINKVARPLHGGAGGVGRIAHQRRAARKRLFRIAPLRQYGRALDNAGGDDIHQQCRLAGAGRAVDGKNAAVGQRFQRGIDSDLLHQKQREFRRPAPNREATCVQRGVDGVKSGHVEPLGNVPLAIEIVRNLARTRERLGGQANALQVIEIERIDGRHFGRLRQLLAFSVQQRDRVHAQLCARQQLARLPAELFDEKPGDLLEPVGIGDTSRRIGRQDLQPLLQRGKDGRVANSAAVLSLGESDGKCGQLQGVGDGLSIRGDFDGAKKGVPARRSQMVAAQGLALRRHAKQFDQFGLEDFLFDQAKIGKVGVIVLCLCLRLCLCRRRRQRARPGQCFRIAYDDALALAWLRNVRVHEGFDITPIAHCLDIGGRHGVFPESFNCCGV